MKIAIVGAGISGLVTAYYLQDFADVTIFEKEKIGGKVQTFKKDNFIFEEGVNGFLSTHTEAIELADEIGLKTIKANENAKIRYIYDDKLYKLPSKPQEFIFSDILSFKGKIRVLQEFFTKPKRDNEDESVYNFAVRRLGKEFADKFMVPMTAGIFAAHPSELSLSSTFPKIKDLEQNYGSLFKGMIKLKKGGQPSGELTSCEYGMGQFIEQLKNNTKVNFIFKTILNIENIKGYDKIILSTPAYESARILTKYQNLFYLLKQIEYNPIIVMGFSGEITPISFGILTTKLETLGILLDKYIYPNRNGFRVMLGGSRFKKLFYSSDEDLNLIATSNIFKITGCQNIKLEFIKKWKYGIPLYAVGHTELIKKIREEEKKLPNIYLNSNAYEGVSFGDCVRNSKKLAEKIINENS